RYVQGSTSLALVAYHNKVQELIVFECDALFDCAPQNVANATLEGITLEASTRIGATTIKASADFQDPHDDATGNLLPRRARSHGAISIDHTLGAYLFGGQFIASSVRYDDAANTLRMGGYGVLNLFTQYQASSQWALLARVDNVFDKNYHLAYGYNTPGASLFAGVRYRY